MISGTRMDIADISDGAGDDATSGIGVGRSSRWFGYGWPSSWGWGGYGGYRRGGAGVESNEGTLSRSMRRGYYG